MDFPVWGSAYNFFWPKEDEVGAEEALEFAELDPWDWILGLGFFDVDELKAAPPSYRLENNII